MNLKKIMAGILAFTLLAVQPVQTVLADEEINVEQGTESGEQNTAEDPNAGKTEEQILEEERARTEAERKTSLETPADTNSLEGWPEGPAVYAYSAVVMDMESGAVLYAKKADEKHFPASITKLLTTLVALENAELTDKVTFSQASVDFLNWDDASIGMRPGEEISLNDALYAVLLASANEVSYAVAESTGTNRLGGGYDTFIDRMNERSVELGCTGSNWVNPNGLHDENHYTTAYDMALIASAVYQKEEFRNMMNMLEYRIKATNLEKEERVFQQNHKMLWPENEFYYEYCTGGKTGYTDQSGTTLVTMADNGKMRLAAVVLQDYGADAYIDTRAMLEYVFNNFSKVPVTELEKPENVQSFEKEDAYIVLPDTADLSKVECEVTGENGGKGEALYRYQGQIAGSADVTLEKKLFVKKSRDNAEEEMKKESLTGWKKIAVISMAVAGIIFVLVLLQKYRIYRRKLRRRKEIQRRRNEIKRNIRG